MDLLSQEPLLSTDEATKGFDLEAGRRWIYPENYPIRQYQFTIAKTALFHNTLVCLPTGLGKTFIAAVVMYNYFRWYPKGIIVFLAPTKSLVAQQINACHEIMGIPVSHTIELTGATNQKKRHLSWKQKRVIFATPQTFQRDLEHKIVPTELIKCIVIDEAHKALGKHSYCESIRMMHETNSYFRLVALSATPGGKVEAVQDVIRNLHITHLELRDETSSDIIPYTNERKLDIILVELGQDLYKFKERYIEIMDCHVKILIKNNVIRGSTANISKGRIFHILKEFQSRQNKNGSYGIVMKTLNILLTMYHAYELIIRHGLRAFYNFYQNHSNKFWLDNEPKLEKLLEDIKQYIGPFPNVRSIIDGSITEIPKNIVFGHDKFKKLQSILIQHFENFSTDNEKSNTRAIVFVEYRDMVDEVYVLLLQSSPLIRPQIFVGQAGLKQKAQKKALEDFRSNHVNVLISTSVGEEGLDVGEVDLIVCFDISQHSPTRLVQRMGRTGRKRNGHIIILVTDGKEHQTLKLALARRDSLNNKVLHSSSVITALQESSPRMIPKDITPECQKIHMTIIQKNSNETCKNKILLPQIEQDKKKSTNKGKKKQQKLSEEPPKKNGQGGSLMKFFTTAPNEQYNDNDDDDDDDNNNDIDKYIISPKIQPIRMTENHTSQSVSLKSINYNAIKPCEVELLTNDHDTIEFLTFCATKQSERDNNNTTDKRLFLEIPYMLKYCTDDDIVTSIYNLKIPDNSILDCIHRLTKYIEPMNECHIIEAMTNTMSLREKFPCNNHEPYPRNDNNKFEDFLNTSDSELELERNIRIESPPLESVDWKNHVNFENSLKNKELQCDGISRNDFDDILYNSSDYEKVNEIITQKIPFQAPKNERNEELGERLAASAFECILDEESDNDSSLTQFDDYDFCVPDKNIIGVIAQENSSDELLSNIGKNKSDIFVNENLTRLSNKRQSDNKDIMKTPVCQKFYSKKSHSSEESYEIHDYKQKNQVDDSLIIGNLSPINSINIGAPSSVNSNCTAPISTLAIISSNQNNSFTTAMNRVSTIKCQASSNESGLSKITDNNKKKVKKIEGIDHDGSQTCVTERIRLNNQLNYSTIQESHTSKKKSGRTNIVNSSSDIINCINNMTEINNVDNIDDFDWSSDFETTLDPIIESKHFGYSIPKSHIELPEKSTNDKKQITEDKLTSIRNTLFAKPNKKFTIHHTPDSDDDFSSTKIEKTVFSGLQNKVKRGTKIIGKINKEIKLKRKEDSSVESDYSALYESSKKTQENEKEQSHILNNNERRKVIRRSGKKRKRKNDLIDDEAQVSSDSCHSNDNSEIEDDDDDEDLADFVSYTQYQDDCIDMKSYYLQNTRSPHKTTGFHIKEPTVQISNEQIYSQIGHDEADSYLYDSFCVRESEEESEDNISPSEITILEDVKSNLNRKRKRENSNESRKRKRILTLNNTSDSSSEDETENMRIAIMNSSITHN